MTKKRFKGFYFHNTKENESDSIFDLPFEVEIDSNDDFFAAQESSKIYREFLWNLIGDLMAKYHGEKGYGCFGLIRDEDNET